MTQKPWVSGPIELLWHGYQHIQLASDYDLRFAMISVDNALEATVFAYLQYVVDRSTMDWDFYKKKIKFFPGKVELLEKYASGYINKNELASILFYHDIRNDLYHKGNGISVELQKVQDYFALSKKIIGKLLQIPIQQIFNQKIKDSERKGESDLKYYSKFQQLLHSEKSIEEFFKNTIQKSQKLTEQDLPQFASQFQDVVKTIFPKSPRKRKKPQK